MGDAKQAETHGRRRATASARRSWKPVSCPRTAGLRLSSRVTSPPSKATCSSTNTCVFYGPSSICYLGFSFLGCFGTLKIRTPPVSYINTCLTLSGKFSMPGVGVLLSEVLRPGGPLGHYRPLQTPSGPFCHLAPCRAYNSEVQPQGRAGPCRVPGHSQA